MTNIWWYNSNYYYLYGKYENRFCYLTKWNCERFEWKPLSICTKLNICA